MPEHLVRSCGGLAKATGVNCPFRIFAYEFEALWFDVTWGKHGLGQAWSVGRLERSILGQFFVGGWLAVVLQQGNAGIIVYFGGTIPYNIGDSLVIDITNDSLIYYRGYLEVKKASSGVLPPTFGTGRTVVPQVKTIAEINTALSLPLYDPGNIENTLVKVVSAAASGNATFSGSNTLTDNTGTITLYTSATALFSGNALPTGSLSWTGYTQNYNQTTKELLLRNAADVQ